MDFTAVDRSLTGLWISVCEITSAKNSQKNTSHTQLTMSNYKPSIIIHIYELKIMIRTEGKCCKFSARKDVMAILQDFKKCNFQLFMFHLQIGSSYLAVIH